MTQSNNRHNCEQARLYYYDCLSNSREVLPPEVLAHIDQCDVCKANIKELRANLAEEISDENKASNDAVTKNLRLHFAYLGKAVTCDDVKPFLPGQVDPILHISIPTPITAHIDNCPQCLEDIKTITDCKLKQVELCKLAQFYANDSSQDHKLKEILPEDIHEKLKSIHQRPNSSIVTIFNTKEGSLDKNSQDSYTGYPIEVKVLNNSKEKKPADIKLIWPKLKTFARPIAVAAGIVALALLIFQGPSAKAVDISAIYRALERIRNICLTTFMPEHTEPTQTIWISQDLNIKVFQADSQWALWNLDDKSLSTKNPDGSVSKVKLDDNSILKVQSTMAVPWGLLPFESLSDIPENHTWRQIEAKEIETTIVGTEVYDLDWTKTSLGGSVVYNRWRGYIAVDTKIPLRIECWSKYSKEHNYTLTTAIDITYPTEQEIKTMIQQVGL